MATMIGTRTYHNPRNGNDEPAVVVAPVAKMFEFATSSGADEYVCLGVVGNRKHLLATIPGDHTWYSQHSTFRTVGGPTISPKHGWIYAGDWTVPDMAKFERWLLARLRAGVYVDVVKYFNILNRHWNRKAVRAGKMFAYSSYSGDRHLHLSIMPGSEYTAVDLFGDYEYFRTTGANRKPPVKPKKPKVKLVDRAAVKLPDLRNGSTGGPVKASQALLVARKVWPRNDKTARSVIDGKFGPNEEAKVRAFQKQVGLEVTGVVDGKTWAALTPDYPATVTRGTKGYYAWLMQLLLLARGFNPGVIDGDAGDKTIAALKRFQVARKVPNSVVKGQGDGIGGTATWVALVTF